MQNRRLTLFHKIFSRQNKAIFGTLIMLFSVAILFAFISFFFTWQEDQSTISDFTNREIEAQNWLSKFGANISYFFMYRGFGIAGFIFPYLFFYLGRYLFVEDSLSCLINRWFWGMFVALWFSMLLSLLVSQSPLVGGAIGYEVNDFLYDYIGKIGLILVLIFGVGVYIFTKMKVTPEVFIAYFKKIITKEKTQDVKEYLEEDSSFANDETLEDTQEEDVYQGREEFYEEAYGEEDTENADDIQYDLDTEQDEIQSSNNQNEETGIKFVVEEQEQEEEVSIEVNRPISEEELNKNLSDKLVESHGEFDPTLELSEYRFPQLDLLVDYGPGSISVDENELEDNKNNIVRTLQSYKVEISSIKATIGPTVTLYEIIPASGVRISKIKNLEDDIALSLAALGIRVIAPMPGKGTVGIEVPNKNSVTVSMRSVIASKKFQSSDMELPIALGKTITNETFVVDLAKMPHLLMAGATGQGKSVGLNAILTSLLYKRHPAEVKFVLVDPKKVELTLFSKIERHFLAKLPDSEDAIITDNSKVINTLNSLCIEMDDRYELLKEAQVRNIKEYNQKFRKRKLNPENGHRFLPYIVLVVDEFADLIMTAGKEVETPIARLAQLARAIGIHLIIATQRPSVNVITGTIKANFPARIAFRVTSGIDSKTILDSQGANQLIGRGDLLYTQGNDLTRVQCAFVDTPEVEEITSFIGAQRAYPEAYLLPEYVGEESSTVGDTDASDRDKLFREAAEVIVVAQQGSTSLIQRKLKLGYNRAGRIIDQLEAAGIVGSFEGSKARQVLIKDLVELDKILDDGII